VELSFRPSIAKHEDESMANPSAFSARIFVAMILCLSAALSLAAPAQQKPAPKTPASKAAADPALIDQQGYRDLLAKYRGKPLLVNFWATWCEPCRDEYPVLNELARKYAPQGLVVVGISLDDDGEITLVRYFLKKNQPVFVNYRKRPGKEEQFINAVNPTWSGAIPATFLYARDGRELGHLVGEHSRDDFETAIRALLGSTPKSAALTNKSGS
jgi:thiol-disulfide isomerase/thioredoxin